MSIRRYLVLMLLSIITLIIFVSAIQGYKASMSKAESLFDDELVSLAQVISAITLPEGVVKHKVNSNFAYQVVMDEEVITRSENAPQRLINKLNNGFKDVNFLGKRWRTYSEKINDNLTANYWIIIAQPLKQRFDL